MTFTHITAVVNESGYVSTFGGVNDGLLINSEHVTASHAAFFITLLSHVSNDLKRKKRHLFLFSLLRRSWSEQRGEPPRSLGKKKRKELVHLSPV